MTFSEINIRDPFILLYKDKYYMYGSRVGVQKGFDVYISDDLINWSDAVSVFENYDEFWGDDQFWAPEVHLYNGTFYMFASFKDNKNHRGTAILKSKTPDGKFTEHSKGAVTPKDWSCLDGTLYVEDNVPYMFFCHEWTQVKDGEICVVRLSDDLKKAVSEPRLLWKGSDASWAFDDTGKGDYVTDGPFLYRMDNRLICMWSGFSRNGYCQAIAYSDNNTIDGRWLHLKQPIYDNNCGHGMLFNTKNGELKLVFHKPKIDTLERPCMIDICEKNITDAICNCVQTSERVNFRQELEKAVL